MILFHFYPLMKKEKYLCKEMEMECKEHHTLTDKEREIEIN